MRFGPYWHCGIRHEVADVVIQLNGGTTKAVQLCPRCRTNRSRWHGFSVVEKP